VRDEAADDPIELEGCLEVGLFCVMDRDGLLIFAFGSCVLPACGDDDNDEAACDAVLPRDSLPLPSVFALPFAFIFSPNDSAPLLPSCGLFK
jgi:hypothetical protein